MSIQIEIPIVFGSKSKDRIIKASFSKLTLDEKFLIGRTVYRYETPIDKDDEKKGYKEELINEKSYTAKDKIVQIGVAYDGEEDVYFVAVEKINKTMFFNVESAEKGNELLNQLIEWWKS
jgi:hypothetical protein